MKFETLSELGLPINPERVRAELVPSILKLVLSSDAAIDKTVQAITDKKLSRSEEARCNASCFAVFPIVFKRASGFIQKEFGLGIHIKYFSNYCLPFVEVVDVTKQIRLVSNIAIPEIWKRQESSEIDALTIGVEVLTSQPVLLNWAIIDAKNTNVIQELAKGYYFHKFIANPEFQQSLRDDLKMRLFYRGISEYTKSPSSVEYANILGEFYCRRLTMAMSAFNAEASFHGIVFDDGKGYSKETRNYAVGFEFNLRFFNQPDVPELCFKMAFQKMPRAGLKLSSEVNKHTDEDKLFLIDAFSGPLSYLF